MEKEERDALIRKGTELKATLVDYEERLKQLENALQYEAQRLPNLTHPDVAIGAEENAVLHKEVGSQAHFSFEVCDLRNLRNPRNSPDIDTLSSRTRSQWPQLQIVPQHS